MQIMLVYHQGLPNEKYSLEQDTSMYLSSYVCMLWTTFFLLVRLFCCDVITQNFEWLSSTVYWSDVMIRFNRLRRRLVKNIECASVLLNDCIYQISVLDFSVIFLSWFFPTPWYMNFSRSKKYQISQQKGSAANAASQ